MVHSMFQRKTANLFQFLQIQGFADVHALKTFVLLQVWVHKPFNEASELLLAVADDHICAPDDQLRPCSAVTGDLTGRTHSILHSETVNHKL